MNGRGLRAKIVFLVGVGLLSLAILIYILAERPAQPPVTTTGLPGTESGRR